MLSNTLLLVMFRTVYDYYFIFFHDIQSHRVILPSGSLFFLRAAYSRRENDGGLYWCNATNSEGSAVSKNVTLTVAGEKICQSDKTFIKVDEQKNRRLFCATVSIKPRKVYFKRNKNNVYTRHNNLSSFVYVEELFDTRKLSNQKNGLTFFLPKLGSDTQKGSMRPFLTAIDYGLIFLCE